MAGQARGLGAALALAAAIVVLAALAGPWLAEPLAAAHGRQMSDRLGVTMRWSGAGVTPRGWIVFRDVSVVPPDGSIVTIPRYYLHAGWPALLARRPLRSSPIRLVLEGAPIWALRPRFEGTYADGVLSGYARWGWLRQPVSARLLWEPRRVRGVDLQLGAAHASLAELDFARGAWTVTALVPSAGPVTVTGRLAEAPGRVNLLLHNVKTGPVMLSTRVQLAASWPPKPFELSGTVTSVGTTLNRQLIAGLAGAWRLRRGALELSSWTLSHCQLSGSIGLAAPHALNLTLDVTDLDAARIAAIIEPGKTPLAGGIVTGRITVTGTSTAPNVSGTLSGRQGRLGGTTFDTANVQFVGEGPVLKFSDTRLRQPTAIVTVEGFLDVTKLGTPTVFQDMRLVSQPARQLGDLAVGRVAQRRPDERSE